MSTQIDAGARAVEFEIMDMLNALPKYADAGKLFGPIQFYADRGGFWAQCPLTGFGFWYHTLHEAVRRWHVTVTAFDNGIWKAEVSR